jgi:uncharacterized membrane protein YgcG
MTCSNHFLNGKYLLLMAIMAIACSFFLVDAVWANDERILSYHSDIRIQADASIEVTEHIQVRSAQRNIRRGIYRDFPTRYRDRYGNRVMVDFEVLEVLRDGQPEPWFIEHQFNGIRVNTGDDRFLPGAGEYTFSIRYRTTRQLGFFEEHDELYWNVTGLGWAFPIDLASAEIHLPEAVDPAAIRLDSYTGPAGATGTHARASTPAPGVARFETTRPLGLREGLTIAVGFPKGIVAEPSTARRAGWLLYDNRGLLVMLLGLIGMFVFYYKAWLSKGRGPEAGVIIARYEPPQGYSPGGLRYVTRKYYDHRCFAADLVELGVKGLLSIEREKKFLRERWAVIRAPDQTRPELPPSQAALLPKLFEGGDRLELHSKNASEIQAAVRAHRAALGSRFSGQYINYNLTTIALGWTLSILIALLAFGVSAGAGLIGTALAGLVLLIVNIVFSVMMPAPTEVGRRLLDHVEGLKLYLGVAERDELKRLQHRNADEPDLTPERYEQLLPYALALDVEDAWTGKFTSAVGQAIADQTQRNLNWYTGSGAALGGLGGMSQSLGRTLSSTISSSSSPPGSSSGGGGGGSSGGGGGGGGGGGR